MVAATVEDGTLVVSFEDGSEARLALATLAELEPKAPDWDRLTVDAYEIVMPSRDGNVEISSFNIRALTDPALAADLAERASESARRIGGCLKTFREGRRLSERALAARSGVCVERLARIEAGTDGISLPALERIVASMDADLGVFAMSADGDPADPTR